jgi:hypothetical protein
LRICTVFYLLIIDMNLINKTLKNLKVAFAKTLQVNRFCNNLFISVILHYKFFLITFKETTFIPLCCYKLTIWQLGKNNFDL